MVRQSSVAHIDASHLFSSTTVFKRTLSREPPFETEMYRFANAYESLLRPMIEQSHDGSIWQTIGAATSLVRFAGERLSAFHPKRTWPSAEPPSEIGYRLP
jgi:hypothetical protein